MSSWVTYPGLNISKIFSIRFRAGIAFSRLFIKFESFSTPESNLERIGFISI
jgi:hypothetical protein